MDNDNIKISKVEVDILKEINKLKKSKLYDIFNRMDIFYMQFLDIVEKLYMKKTKQNVRKELTFHYIFHITVLYDELLKNVYSNNRISIEILSRTLVESLIKFIFIQKIEENNGHFKKCIDFQKFKEFDNIYHNLGKEIEKIVC